MPKTHKHKEAAHVSVRVSHRRLVSKCDTNLRKNDVRDN